MKVEKIKDYSYGWQGGELCSRYEGDYYEVSPETPDVKFVFEKDKPVTLKLIEEMVDFYLGVIQRQDSIYVKKSAEDIALDLFDCYGKTDDIISAKGTMTVDEYEEHTFDISFSIDDEGIKCSLEECF